MILLLALFTFIPNDQAVTDHVDLIEINHVFDDQGRLVLNQVIFYEWSDTDDRYHVIAWRKLRSRWQLPQCHWGSGIYRTTWKDGTVLRSVTAKQLRETWTQYDPELIERNFTAEEERRGLSQPPND